MSGFQGKDLVALMTGGAIESIDTPSVPVDSSVATEFDTEILDVVEEIINEFHKTVTFRIYTSKTYDPTTRKTSPGTLTEKIKLVIPPYQVELKYVDGDLIHAGDMISGIQAKGIDFTLAKGMEVVVNTDVWKIVAITPIYASEKIVLYLFQLRR